MKTPPIDKITLRDYFAAQAIIGLLHRSHPNVYELARDAYKMADGKQFVNGDPDKNFDHISSAEIHACADKTALVDEFALGLRKQHNARFV